MSPRPIRRGAAAALVATLLVAAPVSAHPFFEPDEVPVDSVAELRLQIAHGCTAGHDDADDAAADGEPTREVAVEVPDAVGWVEPAEADGWELELERDEDGAVEVIVYTAAEGTDEAAPDFELEAVHRGEVGDDVHWRVLQACDEGTHRWVGTEEEPAEEPAVTVTLAAADPDRPPPPEADADQDASGEVADGEEAADVGDEPDEPLDDPAEAEEDPDEEDLTADEAGEVRPGWLLIVVLLVTLAIAAVVLLLRNRDDAGTGHE